MGPIILNPDVTTRRIDKRDTMTEDERNVAWRRIIGSVNAMHNDDNSYYYKSRTVEEQQQQQTNEPKQPQDYRSDPDEV
jgi:hypothetical protein